MILSSNTENSTERTSDQQWDYNEAYTYNLKVRSEVSGKYNEEKGLENLRLTGHTKDNIRKENIK